MRSVFKGAVSVFFVLLSQSAIAIDSVTIELTFVPDLQNGRRVYATCAACHLPEGWGSSDGTYPQIAGQHQQVLIKQLLAIRDGHRESSLMYPFVQSRTIGGYQSLVDAVAYIARLPMHPVHEKGPDDSTTARYEKGASLYKTYCSSCHGAHGEGDDNRKIPKLYGQHYPYTKRQIKNIRKGVREVDSTMKTLVDQLDEESLNLIVNYVSYIEVPDAERAPSLDWRNRDFY